MNPPVSTTTQASTSSEIDSASDTPALQIAIPKGRMFTGISRLLSEAGIELKTTARGYRPIISLSGFG